MRIFSVLVLIFAFFYADSTPLSYEQKASKLKELDSQINNADNVWLKQYIGLENYHAISKEIDELKIQLEKDKTKEQNRNLKSKLDTLLRQQELLQEHFKRPYSALLESKPIEEIPSITNPFLILSGYSFIKQLDANKKAMFNNKSQLESLLDLIEQKLRLLSDMTQYSALSNLLEDIAKTQTMSDELQSAKKILETSIDIYEKEADSVINKLTEQIKSQVVKIIYIGIGIILSVLIAFLLKLTLRKYILDSNRIYTASKVINFMNINIIVLILLFAYMENVTYLVAILGFASAGMAIAMKDLFMSTLGWFVIVLGGSVHVGDRVRVVKDGSVFVGDVLDISILRITIFEDITLTSYMENRRAGRIIFIPNNYIFTTMFANYTHSGLKTVWDGIDFSITFDSNHKKAMQIANEIGKKYAKGYTEMVRKQVQKMRDKYSLRNPNLEVRSYCFIESNGLRISLWYQTNAYATLTLRSTISSEIIDRILQEDDIFLAYPTTKVVTSHKDGIGDKQGFMQDSNINNAVVLGGAAIATQTLGNPMNPLESKDS